MTRTVRHLILVVCFSLLTACGLTTATLGSRVPFEPVPDLPVQWGASKSGETDEYGCPLVTGRYEMPPEIVETTDGELRQSIGDAFEPYVLFIGPLRGEKIGSHESGRGPFLELEREAPDTIILRTVTKDKAKEVSYRLSIGPGGLQCVEGYFQLPPYESLSTVEGMWVNFQQFRRFGALSDGSLVYYKQHGRLKKLFGKDGDFRHRFYRFRAMENANTENDKYSRETDAR